MTGDELRTALREHAMSLRMSAAASEARAGHLEEQARSLRREVAAVVRRADMLEEQADELREVRA